jgi:hypothetical protein
MTFTIPFIVRLLRMLPILRPLVPITYLSKSKTILVEKSFQKLDLLLRNLTSILRLIAIRI